MRPALMRRMQRNAAVRKPPLSEETDLHRHAHAAGGTVDRMLYHSAQSERAAAATCCGACVAIVSATGAAYTFAPSSIRADPLGPMYVESEAPVAMLRMADPSASCSLRADAGATRSTVR